MSATELQRQPGRVVRAVLGGQRVTVTNHRTAVMRIVHADTLDGVAVLKRMREFADELRGYCSPHGVSATYADRLEAICDELENGRE